RPSSTRSTDWQRGAHTRKLTPSSWTLAPGTFLLSNVVKLCPYLVERYALMGYPFALVLHTHLPMVVNHGRWPHGSYWLCEAAFECYLPLLEVLHRLVADGISPRWSINLSPVLTEQLASPEFQKELAFYRENVLRACAESREHFTREGDHEIVKLTYFWEEFYERMWELHRRIGGDLPGTFGDLQRQGHIEILTCAATHGYLPLLSRDESIHLQLRTAVETHKRHFGVAPRDLASRVRVSSPLRVDGAHRPRARPEPQDAAGHRGDAGDARHRVLRRRLAPDRGGRARLPLSRLRPTLGDRTRVGDTGSPGATALAVSRVSHRLSWRHRPCRRVLPRSPDDPSGVEPRARLSRRLRLSRIPQEASPGRASLLAHHGQFRQSRRQAAVRPGRGRAHDEHAGTPLRRAGARHGEQGRPGRRRLLAVRRRAVRSLV